MPQPNTLAVNGDAIRKARLLKGLSQTELASAIGISRPYLSHIETGSRTRVSGPVFGRIRDVLEAPDKHILGESPDAGSQESE